VKELGRDDRINAQKFEKWAKSWVKDFADVYHGKNVPPYMHVFSIHVAQFLEIYGSISCFSQQGLEKHNNLTTKYFQHSTNHHERESLLQILQKQNRIEMLEEYHNLRSAPSAKFLATTNALVFLQRPQFNMSLQVNTFWDWKWTERVMFWHVKTHNYMLKK